MHTSLAQVGMTIKLNWTAVSHARPCRIETDAPDAGRNRPMTAVTVLAVYRPKPGKAEALDRLMIEHLPILRAEGLATDHPATVLKAADGTVVEIFEWVSKDAIDRAHAIPAVMALWARFGAA